MEREKEKAEGKENVMKREKERAEGKEKEL